MRGVWVTDPGESATRLACPPRGDLGLGSVRAARPPAAPVLTACAQLSTPSSPLSRLPKRCGACCDAQQRALTGRDRRVSSLQVPSVSRGGRAGGAWALGLPRRRAATRPWELRSEWALQPGGGWGA